MADMIPVRFSNLRIDGWRQFGKIEIALHPQLTVLTGANGAGKSTLLNMFSTHFGFSRPYLSTPFRDKAGGYKFLSGILEYIRKKQLLRSYVDSRQVAEIEYTNGQKSTAQVPSETGVNYQLTWSPQPSVAGFHVSSHRRLPQYQPVQQIPTQPMLPEQAFNQFNSEMASAFQGGHSGWSPTYRIKEALLSMAVFGPSTQFVSGNPALLSTMTGFVQILRRLLPEEVGFLDISIRSPDVVLVTKSGHFLIDAASGGLMALIDLAWHIYMFSLRGDSYVVTIDEPENHLHPSMQRTLMGNLVNTFPTVQFIVATHSPFIVSAVRDARVYVLKYEELSDSAEQEGGAQQSRFVTSVSLDSVSRAGTASEILRDVLGLPTTYPEWASEALGEIIRRYRGQPFNGELLASIRRDLKETGYSDLFPDVVAGIAKQ